MSNVLRLHHCHLEEFLTLTFQDPVAGHRHLRRASERWLEDESRGFVYALWKSSWQALFYHYVMALTASGTLSMTLTLLPQGDRPGKVKMKLCGERSSALRTLVRLFYVIALLYSLPLILCIHSTRTSITSTLPHPFSNVDIFLLGLQFQSAFHPKATFSKPALSTSIGLN